MENLRPPSADASRWQRSTSVVQKPCDSNRHRVGLNLARISSRNLTGHKRSILLHHTRCSVCCHQHHPQTLMSQHTMKHISCHTCDKITDISPLRSQPSTIRSGQLPYRNLVCKSRRSEGSESLKLNEPWNFPVISLVAPGSGVTHQVRKFDCQDIQVRCTESQGCVVHSSGRPTTLVHS